MARTLFLVSYDIRQPGRLREALDLVKGYATGGQKSVYECFLGAQEQKIFFQDLQKVVAAEDDLMFLSLDPRATVFTLGRARSPEDPPFFYFS